MEHVLIPYLRCRKSFPVCLQWVESMGAHDDTIPVELEKSCAEEPIHLLGTVQSYGFLMTVDVASGCIVQTSAGIVRHWPGLHDATTLLSRPLSDWAAVVEGPDGFDLEALPASHPVVLPWRPRFEQTSPAQAQRLAPQWECLGHRSGTVAVIEWLPLNSGADALRHADLALYRAKSEGRSRSVVFELAMAANQRDHYLLERDLDEAVERNQLSLVFQPKVDLISRKVVGLEALVRWNHPTRGQSSPNAFIPIAEHSDQIIRIDRWVMRKAIAEQAHWRSHGLAKLPIAINLSIADILSPNLVDYLARLLEEYGVPPAALEIEVTESCFMRQLDQTRSVLRALNKAGIATSLDDLGTGFSSLSYLRQLPWQCLKIDQSFTQNMLQDPNAEKLTQAIVAMGNALKMTVVAEGVESREQMNWLLAHDCHIGQGYFFSPPVPPEDVPQVIERIEVRLSA